MKREEGHPQDESGALFRRVAAYVGFGATDSARLAGFYPEVEPDLDAIIEDFYGRIATDPGAARTITGGAAQIARLKGTLRAWLVRFLRGPHDDEFARLQARIGRAHIAVGLEQWYMVSGIHVFREHLNRVLFRTRAADPAGAAATQRAFVKLLDITLALMLETYREDYLRRILESEQNATFRRLAAMGEVAAALAHEVRNPLAGISGAIQVLRDADPGATPRREVLDRVLGEIRRLDARVHEVLEYARPATPRRERVDIGALLETTAELLSGDPKMGRVRVLVRHQGGSPVFPVDPALIQQVAVNLILNAAEAIGGTGVVGLETRIVDGGALEIAVQDSGPGVPAELAEEIFRPFFTTRRGGTGLGLAISRKLVESHGGRLRVEPAPGGGARFILVLPPPAPATAAGASTPAP
jgi:signal transduction histidine kinase